MKRPSVWRKRAGRVRASVGGRLERIREIRTHGIVEDRQRPGDSYKGVNTRGKSAIGLCEEEGKAEEAKADGPKA